MKIEQLLDTSCAWMRSMLAPKQVVMGTLARVVRAMPEHVYPGWSHAGHRFLVVEQLMPVLRTLPGMKRFFAADMQSLAYTLRRLLMERKLCTPCMAARQEGCLLLLPQLQDFSLMVNEEEHLVIHAMEEGQQLGKVLNRALQVASQVEAQVGFAYDEEVGHLTSIPQEAGDGVQFFVSLHLPGVCLTDSMPKLSRALEKMDVLIKPYHSLQQGEMGQLYVLCSQTAQHHGTLALMKHLEFVLAHITDVELGLRRKLTEDNRLELMDAIGRALGLLRYAGKLSFRPMVDAFSLLRLGADAGLLRVEGGEAAFNAALASLMTYLAHGHLSFSSGDDKTGAEVLRATRVREFVELHHLSMAEY